ncbi:MAG: hypothetical protein PHE51_04805 [Eubacteriales bacterium]|nr:hypothetical protein [Eubacteriales bacterium]
MIDLSNKYISKLEIIKNYIEYNYEFNIVELHSLKIKIKDIIDILQEFIDEVQNERHE